MHRTLLVAVLERFDDIFRVDDHLLVYWLEDLVSVVSRTSIIEPSNPACMTVCKVKVAKKEYSGVVIEIGTYVWNAYIRKYYVLTNYYSLLIIIITALVIDECFLYFTKTIRTKTAAERVGGKIRGWKL